MIPGISACEGSPPLAGSSPLQAARVLPCGPAVIVAGSRALVNAPSDVWRSQKPDHVTIRPRRVFWSRMEGPEHLRATAPRIFSSEYYERMRALESHSWWNASMRDIAGSLLDDAGLAASGRLLDAGCGSGQTIAWFRDRRPQWSAAGLDIDSDATRAARSAGHRVVQGSVTDLPFAESCADVVITLDVLQHLPLDGGDVRALAEMRRVLRPGGILLVRTNAQSFPTVEDDPQADFRRYTPALLRASLAAAGFDITVLGRVNVLPGLAEIPRELRARRAQSTGYHGILSEPPGPRSRVGGLARRWMALEGRALRAGLQLPLGRTIFAVCRPLVTNFQLGES